ncbi:MAG TPA: efflux RND transporter periplasmic adaptor subunit [Verrucomicrobiae bacterium]
MRSAWADLTIYFMPEKTSGGWWKWIGLALMLALGAGAYFYFRHGGGDALNFNTVAVTRGELTATVTATGTLNPVVNVTVGSQVSGRISKLYVDYNSPVTKGEVLAEIDPSTYQAAAEQANADLANAKANLELQQVQFDRSSELFTNKLISGSDYDIALATLHEAEAMVKIKQASVSNSQVNLDYCKIVSPVDGVVISRAVELGQTVASSFNTPTIFQIANDLTKMQIDSNVAEADVGGVVEGQSVDFTVDAYPTRTFHGEVTQVRNSPITVNNVVTYDTVISVTNADYKLKPGMTANVSVITAQREDALKIPNVALRFRPPDGAVVLTNAIGGVVQTNEVTTGKAQHKNKGGHGLHTVYILAGSARAPQLKPMQIKTGITDGIFTEIVDGLKEGDKVVSSVAQSDSQNSAAGSSSPFGGRFSHH